MHTQVSILRFKIPSTLMMTSPRAVKTSVSVMITNSSSPDYTHLDDLTSPTFTCIYNNLVYSVNVDLKSSSSLLTESQVFSVGGHASRTRDSPSRWGIETIIRAVSPEALTGYDWLLSNMISDVSTDDSEDYSVSF